MKQDVVFKVKSKIYGHGRGWSFSPKDFCMIGNDFAVRKTLDRLEKSGLIRRIIWGLYDYPKKHPKLGILPPEISEVVNAISRKDNIRTMPSGAYAANIMGLSEQVPAKIIYLTEGPSKKVPIGKQILIFKKTTLKNIATANSFAGLLIQALKYLGKDQVEESTILSIKKKLQPEHIKSLKKYKRYAPGWIQKHISTLTEEANK